MEIFDYLIKRDEYTEKLNSFNKDFKFKCKYIFKELRRLKIDHKKLLLNKNKFLEKYDGNDKEIVKKAIETFEIYNSKIEELKTLYCINNNYDAIYTFVNNVLNNNIDYSSFKGIDFYQLINDFQKQHLNKNTQNELEKYLKSNDDLGFNVKNALKLIEFCKRKNIDIIKLDQNNKIVKLAHSILEND